MKKILNISLLFLTLATIVVSCKKDGEESGDKFRNAAQGSYLMFDQTPVTSGAPIRFSYATIATSTASIKVKLNQASQAIDSVVVYEGSSTNKATWRRIKAYAFTGPLTLSVTGAEIASARGVAPSALVPGTNFTFYNEVVTKSGQRWGMYNTSSDYESQAPYLMAMRWFATVFCAFDQNAFNGKFKVKADGWADFAIDELVDVAPVVGNPNQIQILAYPGPAYGSVNRQWVKITVDPNTNLATVPFQIYGDYPPDLNFGVQGSGSVNSCTGTISLSLNHRQNSATGPNYGTYPLLLQK